MGAVRPEDLSMSILYIRLSLYGPYRRYNIVSIGTLAGLDWSVWGWAVLGTLNPFQDYGARLCWVVPGCVGDHERLLQCRKGTPLGWVGLGWLGLC